jgi:DnaJ-like protein
MQYLLLGLAALLLFLLAARIYTTANPQVLLRQLRIGAGVAALAAASFFVFRGFIGYAIALAALALLLLVGIGVSIWSAQLGTQPRGSSKTSRVKTEHLEVELHHDTGNIRGRVLKGHFKGRQLQDLADIELAHLWRDCRFADPPSAQILEAYLDRAHPNWREDLGRAEGGDATGREDGMTREQALEVLGLEAGASEDDIRRAHRELMMKMHPDRGGSTYLAAKINEAKEVLLG